MSGRLVIIVVTLFISCSTFPRLSREEQWAYFEDWDLNNDLKIDANEFERGYIASGFFRTWSAKQKSLSNSALAEKLAGATPAMKRSVAFSVGRDTLASNKADETKTQSDQPNDALPAFVDHADDNNDGMVTKQEWAHAMYLLADENSDMIITSLEFYRWQLLRG